MRRGFDEDEFDEADFDEDEYYLGKKLHAKIIQANMTTTSMILVENMTE